MWQFSRFLFWLGEQSWFPFSTLHLWYWTLGHLPVIEIVEEYVECLDCEEIIERRMYV